MTINQTAKAVGLPSSCLRSMHSAGNLPGFYSGNRFYVNVEQLWKELEQASRSTMSDLKKYPTMTTVKAKAAPDGSDMR